MEETRKRHYDARHNCWCYLLKDGAVRYSDDGEPQGTGGQPMLNVFQRESVTNVCCVVTRYFGGILLGAGGLTRAYARGAKDALDAAGVCRMSLWTGWEIPCTYPLFERLKLEIGDYGGVVRSVDYGADILLHTAFPADGAERFRPRLTELSAGRLAMNGYVADVTRYRKDAARGIVEKIFYESVMTFKAEGIEWASLALAPLARLEEESDAAAKLLNTVYERMNDVYGFKALYQAKLKYNPTHWEPCYYVYYPPRLTPAVAYSVIRIQNSRGVLDYAKALLRNGFRRRSGRETA